MKTVNEKINNVLHKRLCMASTIIRAISPIAESQIMGTILLNIHDHIIGCDDSLEQGLRKRLMI